MSESGPQPPERLSPARSHCSPHMPIKKTQPLKKNRITGDA